MKKIFILLMALSLLSTSCSNVLTAMANKETDEAYFETAQKSMDSQDWDTALTALELMSETYKARTDVIEMWAGVLAGKCGFDFITYFNSLGSASLTGSTIFKYFMNAFTGKSVSASYCALAQLKMEEIGSIPSARTSGQNLFRRFWEWSRLVFICVAWQMLMVQMVLVMTLRMHHLILAVQHQFRMLT